MWLFSRIKSGYCRVRLQILPAGWSSWLWLHPGVTSVGFVGFFSHVCFYVVYFPQALTITVIWRRTMTYKPTHLVKLMLWQGKPSHKFLYFIKHKFIHTGFADTATCCPYSCVTTGVWTMVSWTDSSWVITFCKPTVFIVVCRVP